MRAKTERERLEEVLFGQAELLQEVYDLLSDEQRHDDLIRASVRSSRKEVPVAIADPEPSRVFAIDAIEALCVKHRLRFLPGALYKGELPGQAVLAIRELELQVGTPVTSFMVMAPSAQFRLCDSETDPLLFVPMGGGRYYLVARWGADMARWRSVVFWPVRRPLHLALAVLAAALALTAFTPAPLLGDGGEALLNGQRLLLLFWCVMVLSGFTLFGWFAFFGQFSKDAWSSRYFN